MPAYVYIFQRLRLMPPTRRGSRYSRLAASPLIWGCRNKVSWMKLFEKSVYIYIYIYLFLAYGLHCTQSHCGGGDPLSITFGLARGDYPVGLGEAGDSYCGCIIVTWCGAWPPDAVAEPLQITRRNSGVKRKTQNATRKTQNAKRKTQNAKRKTQNAKRKT